MHVISNQGVIGGVQRGGGEGNAQSDADEIPPHPHSHPHSVQAYLKRVRDPKRALNSSTWPWMVDRLRRLLAWRACISTFNRSPRPWPEPRTVNR